MNIISSGISSGWQSGGTVTLVLSPVLPGEKLFNIRINQLSSESTNCECKIYLNDVLLKTESFVLTDDYTHSSGYRNITYNPPLAAGFNFYTEIANFCGQRSAQLYFTPLNNGVASNVWHLTEEEVSISITEGMEFASFIDINTFENLGDNLLVPYTEIENIAAAPDDPLAPLTNSHIKVTTEVGGVQKEDEEDLPGPIQYAVDGSFTFAELNYIEPENLIFWISGPELPFFCPPIIPESLTYTAEIIQGQDYCYLTNLVNGEKGKKITGIAHNYWSASIEILAEDKIPTQAIPITVRISTSEEGITPYEFNFNLQKSNFFAEAEPDTITQGDIAALVFKKIEEDGTLTELPAEQGYSLNIVSGAEYGTIYSYNTKTTADEFTGTAGQFEFRAEEIIEEDSVYVEIIVTPEVDLPAAVVKAGGGELNKNLSIVTIDENELISDNIVKQKDEQIEVTGDNNAMAIESESLGIAKIRILITKERNCSKDKPKLTITEVDLENMVTILKAADNDANCSIVNPKTLKKKGGFTIHESVEYTPSVSNLFYHLKTIEFEITWGICIDNINEIYNNPQIIDYKNGKFINVLTEIQITKNEAKQALKDFARSNNNSPGGFSGTGNISFYPLPKTIEHEFEHIAQRKRFFEKHLNIAIEKINNPDELPDDWCDPDKIDKVKKERYKIFQDIMNDAANNINLDLEGSSIEPDAEEAGHQYVINTLIPAIKQFINN